MKHRSYSTRSGFTLVEIMIVVLTIALLSVIALPSFRKARTTSLLTRISNDMKVFGDAFDLYAMEHRGYPPDCHLPEPFHLPNSEMEEYINLAKWTGATGVGGNYNWEGPDVYPYAGIAIFGASAGEDIMRRLDKLLDNGDLASGMFRLIADNSRYTYILEE